MTRMATNRDALPRMVANRDTMPRTTAKSESVPRTTDMSEAMQKATSPRAGSWGCPAPSPLGGAKVTTQRRQVVREIEEPDKTFSPTSGRRDGSPPNINIIHLASETGY